MQVINNEPHMIVATFDGRIDIRLQPGDTAEVEGARRVDVRPIVLETTEEPRYAGPPHRRTVLDDFDSGDGR